MEELKKKNTKHIKQVQNWHLLHITIHVATNLTHLRKKFAQLGELQEVAAKHFHILNAPLLSVEDMQLHQHTA